MLNGPTVNVTARILILFLSVLITECGRVKRVIGGVQIDCGTQLRVASLRNATDRTHLCGAMALTDQYAVTAAHCVVKSPEQYLLELTNACDERPWSKVYQVFVHHQYDRRAGGHDIAVVRVALGPRAAGWLADNVLPVSSFGLSGDCKIYGYGTRYAHLEDPSATLVAADVVIVSLDYCTEALGPIAPANNDGMMCALGQGADACQGDSGSPLMCGSSVEGITSYGQSCGAPGVPGVYTSIGAHLPWIRHIIDIK